MVFTLGKTLSDHPAIIFEGANNQEAAWEAMKLISNTFPKECFHIGCYAEYDNCVVFGGIY